MAFVRWVNIQLLKIQSSSKIISLCIVLCSVFNFYILHKCEALKSKLIVLKAKNLFLQNKILELENELALKSSGFNEINIGIGIQDVELLSIGFQFFLCIFAALVIVSYTNPVSRRPLLFGLASYLNWFFK